MARLGRYEIVRQLVKGALTDLLIGCSTGMEGFQRYVAIKRLRAEFAADPKCLEAFVAEARLAAHLHHHNIVQVHDIDQESGQPFFAMEYVHGIDLRTLLMRLAKRNEQLPLQHVVQIIAAAAAALHHAHEQRSVEGKPLGIVHRDVTPANILVGYDGNVKVVDFGIAKAAIKRIKTDQGVLKGSVPYMAPEQCAGNLVDRRSDVFALGVVLYELATVRRLFKGASEFLTMSAIVAASVPMPSQYRKDIPRELETIMLRALAREPSDRFQTAGDMSLALDKVASMVGVGASTTALANYMRLQFGEPKEPWLLTDNSADDNEPTLVDFDGGASGLAPPPSEAVHKTAIPRAAHASKSSPIAAARVHALTPITEQNVPTIDSARLRPVPRMPTPRTGRIAPGPRTPDLHAVDTDVDTDVDMIDTDIRKSPQIATEPLPPLIHEPKPRHPTQIVTPLPQTYALPPVVKPPSRFKWLLAAALIGGGVAAALVWWPARDVLMVGADPVVEQETPEPAPEPADERGGAMEMSMRDYERAQVDAAAVEPPPVEPAVAAEVKPEIKPEVANPEVEPEVAEPEVKPKVKPEVKPEVKPAKTITAKSTPAPKRTPAKPAAAKQHDETKKPPPAKKKSTAKKKWNPDDLFLDEK